MNARDYQNKIRTGLQHIFPNESVEREWDSVKFDFHTGNHRDVYAPRHDLAVSPFNTYPDLDISVDRTKVMQTHPFTKRLIKDKLEAGLSLKKLWNSSSRCYLAIEIEFSGSSKHILGSILNASVSGSLGIVVADSHNRSKIDNLVHYFLRLESLELLKLNKIIANLFVFEDDEFLDLLSEFVPPN